MCRGLAVVMDKKGKIYCDGVSSHIGTCENHKLKEDECLKFEIIVTDKNKLGYRIQVDKDYRKNSEQGREAESLIPTVKNWVKKNETQVLRWLLFSQSFAEHERTRYASYWKNGRSGFARRWNNGYNGSASNWRNGHNGYASNWQNSRSGYASRWKNGKDGIAPDWQNGQDGYVSHWKNGRDGFATFWQNGQDGYVSHWKNGRDGFAAFWQNGRDGYVRGWECGRFLYVGGIKIGLNDDSAEDVNKFIESLGDELKWRQLVRMAMQCPPEKRKEILKQKK